MRSRRFTKALIIGLVVMVVVGLSVYFVFLRSSDKASTSSTKDIDLEEAVSSKSFPALPLYPGIKWGVAREERFTSYDRDGPPEVQGYVIQSEQPISPDGPDAFDIYFKFYQPWLKQEGWQGYADFAGGHGPPSITIGWKKGGKYFFITEEKSDQGEWFIVIQYN